MTTSTRRTTILLLARRVDASYRSIAAHLAGDIGITVHELDEIAGTSADFEPATTVIMTIGGDGTFLVGARWASRLGVPVFGINTGRLGFLAELDPHDLQYAIEAIYNGDYEEVHRPLIITVLRTANEEAVWMHTSLNDVVLRTQEIAVAHFDLSVNDEPCAEIDGDGLIIATPTGSTAYAMSAGGPIIVPDLPCMLLVPLAPHALMPRSLVIGPASVVRVTVHGGAVLAAADATHTWHVEDGSTLQAHLDGTVTSLHFLSSPSFMTRLHDTMLFGAPLRIRDVSRHHRSSHRVSERT